MPAAIRRRAAPLRVLAPCLLVFATAADAHVKWFVEFHVEAAPKPPGEVFSATFVELFLLSVVLIYLLFLADRIALRRSLFAALDQRFKQFDGFSIATMRLSAAVFFLGIFAWWLVTGDAFYLTPELSAREPFVPWLHALLGLCALWRRSVPLVGLGIALLYGLALARFGLFHMIDYTIFLGIGYFCLVAAIGHGRWRVSGFIVLFASTGLTLTWAAMEKFAYPEWTYPMLERNPGMLMGMTPYLYMTLAGFVEFNVTFMLLGVASVGARVVALGLQAVFVLAIFKFGVIDALGHLMIIAVLVVLVVRGPTRAREILVLRDKSVWMEAYFMTGLYCLAFDLIFIAYYGLHRLFFGV